MTDTPRITGVDWDLVNEDAANWARDYGGELVKDISTTTRRGVGNAVGDFYSQGLTMGDLTSRLGTVFSPQRAEMIAVTEVTRAAAEGEREVARQLAKDGIDMVEVWQTSNDDLVCTICAPRNGKKEGDGWTKSEGPPAHPRCRCWVNHEFEKTEQEKREEEATAEASPSKETTPSGETTPQFAEDIGPTSTDLFGIEGEYDFEESGDLIGTVEDDRGNPSRVYEISNAAGIENSDSAIAVGIRGNNKGVVLASDTRYAGHSRMVNLFDESDNVDSYVRLLADEDTIEGGSRIISADTKYSGVIISNERDIKRAIDNIYKAADILVSKGAGKNVKLIIDELTASMIRTSLKHLRIKPKKDSNA